MPSPYQCERFHPTRGSSRRKSLFLNFANAKAAAPGFECETRGDLLSLSFVVAPQRASPPRPTWSLLNNLVWIFGKSLYQMTSTIFFSNFRSLARPGFIIETLKYSPQYVHCCSQNIVLRKVYITETDLMTQLTQNSPHNSYIS